MVNCPYCGGKLKGKLALPLLPKRKSLIYDAVLAAGADGIHKHDLLTIMFDGSPPTPGGHVMLRVQVHELNKRLIDLKQRIVGVRGVGYVLTSAEQLND